MTYDYLWQIAIILLGSHLIGIFTKRIKFSLTMGGLLTGILFGPAVFGIVSPSLLSEFAAIGLLTVYFAIGTKLPVKEIVRSNKTSRAVAIGGVMMTFGLTLLIAWTFNQGSLASTDDRQWSQNIAIGLIMATTSVGLISEMQDRSKAISLETANCLKAAAKWNYLLCIPAWTILTTVTGDEDSVIVAILKLILFVIFAIAIGYLVVKGMNILTDKTHESLSGIATPVLSIVLCLLMAFTAQTVFGVPDIIGGLVSGMIIAQIKDRDTAVSPIKKINHLLFAPVVFAYIGLNVTPVFDDTNWLLLIVSMIAVVVLSKIIGGCLGQRVVGGSLDNGLELGSGLLCYGGLSLLILVKSASLSLIPVSFFSAMVFTMIVATLLMPVILWLLTSTKKLISSQPTNSGTGDDMDDSAIVVDDTHSAM